MGCDIHLYVEKYNGNNWEAADTFEKVEYGDDCLTVSAPYYHGRNYNLFAILAGVRNGNNHIPITLPKGLPHNVCKEVKNQFEFWDSDAHSTSFFSVKELLDFDWTRSTIHSGVVSMHAFAKWKFLGEYGENYPAPPEYAGAVMGNNVVIVSEEEMVLRVKAVQGNRGFWEAEEDLKTAGRIYAEVSWEEKYYETAGTFWSNTMPRLLALCNGDYESVRIVFWFDN
jgi:hypothetical protein